MCSEMGSGHSAFKNGSFKSQPICDGWRCVFFLITRPVNKQDLRIRFCLVLELQAQFGECYKQKGPSKCVCVCVCVFRDENYWILDNGNSQNHYKCNNFLGGRLIEALAGIKVSTRLLCLLKYNTAFSGSNGCVLFGEEQGVSMTKRIMTQVRTIIRLLSISELAVCMGSQDLNQ